MNMQQFYKDLFQWIMSVNQASQDYDADDYWQFIYTTAGQLSDQYENHPLVKAVIIAHIDYLESFLNE